MFNNICIIGVGTLGGFVCKHLAEQESVKEITVIDDDIIQSKNTYNSIYGVSMIGEFKVDCIEHMLKNIIPIRKIRQKYFEGKTEIPTDVDLMVDCRDELYDRYGEIDIRLFISNRTLVFDCRKTLTYSNKYKGEYSIQLTKNELNRAGFFAAQLISGGAVKEFIKNEIIHTLNLEILPKLATESTERAIEARTDLFYENSEKFNIHGLNHNLKNILEINKYQPIEVYVGEKDNFLAKSAPKTNFTVIPQNELNNPIDLNNFFERFLLQNKITKNFIIILKAKNNNYFIELLEETGAA